MKYKVELIIDDSCTPLLKVQDTMLWHCMVSLLGFQGNGTRGSVEHPGSADLSRTKSSEASQVIGSVEQGMGMLNPAGSNRRGSWWASAAASK